MTFLAAQCNRCKLIQAAAAECRRCERTLPAATAFIQPDPETAAAPLAELPTVAEAELQLIREAVRRSGGSGLRAARMLGIGKTTLYRKANQHGIPLKRSAKKEAS